MRWRNRIALLLLGWCVALSGYASTPDELSRFDDHPEHGWYFDALAPKKPVLRLVIVPQAPRHKPLSKRQQCHQPGTWTADCGFIPPTSLGLTPTAVWAFEQQEYHQLLHRYALYPNNAKEVYHFQKFQYWALDNAMTASYTWQFNREQHPDVNASVNAPVSQFGLRLIKHIESHSEPAFWRTLSKTAFFMLVTRTDNAQCQAQGQLLRRLAREKKMVVWNLSIDGGHLPGFTHVMHYYALPAVEQHALATHLSLNWLPALYLYLKPVNHTQVGRWIRVATGITTLDAIESRTLNFVQAYRHAIVQGAGKKRHLAPDFSRNHLYPLVQRTAALTTPQQEAH